MALPDKMADDRMILVDNEEHLPFGLNIKVGSGYSQEVIPVHTLTTSTQRVTEVVYKITELKDLTVELVTPTELEVKVRWNKPIHYDDEEENYSEEFTLNHESSEKVLFSNASGAGEYPWRCGMYWFEIEYNHRFYLGAFEIVPKNIDADQWQQIHQMLYQYLGGLLVDPHTYHKSLGSAHYHNKDLFYWRYFYWFQTRVHSLLTGLNMIEQNAKISLYKRYEIENRPGRRDQRSLHWELSKGKVYGFGKYYNRHMEAEWDQQDNRMAKYKVLQILKKLDQCEQQVKAIYDQCREAQEQAYNKKREQERAIEQLRQNPLTTERSKKRHLSQLMEIEDKLKSLESRIEQLIILRKRMSKYKHQVHAYLNTPFWQAVRPFPDNKISLAKERGYTIIHQLWKESQTIVDVKKQDQEMIVPAHLPTYLLYEYFVYFGVVRCLEEIGFQLIEKNLSNADFVGNFGNSGLSDGFTLSLQRDEKLINVVYNEMIEPDEYSAEEKQTYFYSGGVHRKPDIRVDQYILKDEEWHYQSSIILEVKYRPLKNIINLDGQGDTKAMEQMNDYRSIGYKYPQGGYNYSPVWRVFCVYPEDRNSAILFQMRYGMMLQFYPRGSSSDPLDIVGKEALTQQMEEWIEEIKG